jgi:heme-degrading monooxygenase HmoA
MDRHYVYVWEFAVLPEHNEVFHRAYGPNGSWAERFRRSDGYVGTLLLQDQLRPGRYLTIDRWSSATAHDAFAAQFREDYARLDRECEAFTESEMSLGSYWEVTD